MGTYEASNEIGDKGVEYAKEFLDQMLPGCQVIETNCLEYGSQVAQKHLGDLLVQTDRLAFGVEVKTERKWTGNLDLETWSNKVFGIQTEGWMVCLKCKYLLYIFLEPLVLYSVKFPDLWTWFFGEVGERGSIDQLREVLTRSAQKNKTHGRLARIQVLMEQCGLKEFRRTESGVWFEESEVIAS